MGSEPIDVHGPYTSYIPFMMNLFLLQSAALASEISLSRIDKLLEKLLDMGFIAGRHILAAILVYLIGAFVVKLLNRLVRTMLTRRKVDDSVKTFLQSLTNILLTLLLIISVIGALGVNTTSFAALLASAGVAVGMALSGNLSNFAGGLVVLLFKPYRVGDWIEAQGTSGTVTAIQIFHTILRTSDNRVVYIPNGALSSNTVINYSREETRRVQWQIGVDYGQDIAGVREALLSLFESDERILQNVEGKTPFVGLENLGDSSVNLVIRVWVANADYWAVYYQLQERIYNLFNEKQINIPYPQTVVHLQRDSSN